MLPLKPVGVVPDITAVTERVVRIFSIESTLMADGREEVVRYRGRLTQESDQAYRWLYAELKTLGCTPLFRKDGDQHLVIVKPGIIDPSGTRMWLVWLLLALTILSMLYTGGSFAYDGPAPQTTAEFLRLLIDLIAYIPLGMPFMLSMIGILGAHELGHYIAARLHREPASPPFFIPLPFPFSVFGTLGAVIMLKSPPVNRRVMLDIGVAGPLAGLIVAIPVLTLGLITSAPLRALDPNQVSGFEGNSIVYVLLKYAVFGRFLPEPASFGDLAGWLYMLRFYTLGIFTPGGGTDVFLNDIAWAGWGGLLITSLNLIPVGQLDGGHAMFVLLGRRAQRIWPIAVGALVALGFVWPGWWLWAGLIFLFGRMHVEPLDQITELGPVRRGLAVLMPVLWVLLFMPVPLQA